MNNKRVKSFGMLPTEEMTWHSKEQVPPTTLRICEGLTAPNVGFLPKVNTTNLSEKF